MAAADSTSSSFIRMGYVHSAPLLNAQTRLPIPAVDTEEEIKQLRDILQESHQRVCFSAVVATVFNFSQLLSKGCRVVHYTGHGLPDGNLAFENERGELFGFERSTLRNLHKSTEGLMPKLVFVAACHSQAAGDAFVEAGVPHVVAVRLDSKVLDEEAIKFSRLFYERLLSGESVQSAFQVADSMVQANRVRHAAAEQRGADDDHGSQFMLLPQNNAVPSHDEVIFPRDPSSKKAFVDETPPLPVNHCDFPPKPFVARHLELYNIFRNFVEDNRCVTAIGCRGIGKTVLAHRAAVHLQQRNIFCRILSLDLRPDGETLRTVRSKMGDLIGHRELVVRAFAMVLENARSSDRQSATSGKSALQAANSDRGGGGAGAWEGGRLRFNSGSSLWMRAMPPLLEDLVAMVEDLAKWTSMALAAPSDSSAQEFHEQWRREQNAKAVWKKMARGEEYREWAQNVPRSVLVKMHRYATQHDKVEAPDEDVPLVPVMTETKFAEDTKSEEVGTTGRIAYHWVDINQPYEYLPESWKERNRRGSYHNPATLKSTQQKVLVVIDGADRYRTEVAVLANDIFKKSRIVYILSTCRTALTPVSNRGPSQMASPPSDSTGASELLLTYPEKLVKVDDMSHMEAAELLVHAAPRQLRLQEMGVAPDGRGCTFQDAIKSLANQPALQRLEGHPSAIRRFALHLGKANAESTVSTTGQTWCKLHQLEDVAVRCREDYNPGMAQALLEAKSRLEHDDPSVRLWAKLTCNLVNEDEPLTSVPWNGARGLIQALEEELDAITIMSTPLEGHNGAERASSTQRRTLTSSDQSFLRSIIRKPSGNSRAGESKARDDDSVSYAEYVLHIVEWTLCVIYAQIT
jgi:hypothetical protein